MLGPRWGRGLRPQVLGRGLNKPEMGEPWLGRVWIRVSGWVKGLEEHQGVKAEMG